MSARQGTRSRRGVDDDDLEPGDEYGYTFGLTSTGDLQINRLKKFREIEDINAVVQDLKIALMTVQGEDPMREEFGLDIFEAVGTSDPRLRAEIGATIGPNADPRVQRVNEVAINREGGNREDVTVEITVTLRDGTMTSFDFTPRRRINRS